MKAGRELDALVAEKVMGWDDSMWIVKNNHGFTDFSENIAAAWQVVERFFAYDIGSNGELCLCKFSHSPMEPWFIAAADTAPLAICLAALKAVGYEEA